VRRRFKWNELLANTNSFSAEAFTVEGIIHTIDEYAYSQNTKNATLAASLFACGMCEGG
jgi:hypothetical protein